MANPKKRLDTNADGNFFVDSTCIDCDTCRQIAPDIFKEEGEYSSVYHQPQTEAETRNATRALLACPTGSIGTLAANAAKEIMNDFPMRLEETQPDDGVYYVGFNSPKSYGGHSYFIRHPQGNWLVDSPKYLPHLVEKFKAMGGIKYIFLTHRDDVADAAKYAAEFRCERIIHKDELSAQPDAEQVISGTEDIFFSPDFRIIPTPGHTKGHCVLLYKDRFLFTGDHMSWRDERHPHGPGLGASEAYCWYSFDAQKDSIRKLANYTFEWVLPGHGRRMHLSPDEMQTALKILIQKL